MSKQGSAWFKRKRIPFARDLLRKAIIPGDINAVEETVFGDFWWPAAGSATQTLTASLFTNTNTFYAHTLVRGAVTLTPSLFTNSNTFYTHVISQGGATQTLMASLFTNTNSFYAHTINAGAVTLTPSLFSNTNSFYAHTLNRGTVTLSPSLFSNANSFYTHAVTPGAVTLTAALFSNSNAFYTHTIVQAGGPQTLLPNLFLNDNTFYAHEITQIGVGIDFGGHFGLVGSPQKKKRLEKLEAEVVEAIAEVQMVPERQYQFKVSPVTDHLDKLQGKIAKIRSTLDKVSAARMADLENKLILAKQAEIERVNAENRRRKRKRALAIFLLQE